ncbi:unnamed protein product [Brachionus calyciflorus]|uniref:Uncharacterized protein n=1 Tax=Brachionus calyciflorus TaxID=104777 RepID=A0A813N7Y9_9BILA|nr:unnamed protein product [Brachionus calyciflorus]
MLHITSILQNASYSKIQNDRFSLINGLNRNYSFVHDTYSNRYDFNYNIDSYNLDDYETNLKGYWGYIRDKHADRNISTKNPIKIDYDGYWGQFEDNQSEIARKLRDTPIIIKPNEEKTIVKPSQAPLDSDNFQKFNYKISQLKIQAKKREDDLKNS